MYNRFLWIAPKPMAAKYARCGHPSQLSLVDGGAEEFCTMKRDKHAECGPDAKLWEAKEIQVGDLWDFGGKAGVKKVS